MFYVFCTLLYVHSSIAIILMGKRELIALLNLSSWCLMMVERLFLAVPWVFLQFVVVIFPDHTHYFCCILQGLISVWFSDHLQINVAVPFYESTRTCLLASQTSV